MSEWLIETLHPELRQQIRIDRILHKQKTHAQELLIFENDLLGRVLALDGIVQTTEADEFIYHEMITHVPILAHGAAQDILVLGGGDGGVIEELFKYPTVTKVVMVEIDPCVVELCRKYLPNLSRGAFDDPRLDLVIADGSEYVISSTDHFDVIIVDSPDPIGPGEKLFSKTFYSGCHRRLKPGGILVTQSGVPFVQGSELRNSARNLSAYFHDVTFYRASIPTYYGGDMAFGWASDTASLRTISLDQIRERFSSTRLETRYYSPEIHLSAFAKPPWITALLNDR